ADDNERRIAYALDMLGDVKDASIVEAVRPLLRHDSADIRRRAAAVLQTQDGDHTADLKPLLDDEDPRVQRDAMYYVCVHAAGDTVDLLGSYLTDPDPRVKAVALSCAAEYGGPRARRLIDDSTIRALIETDGEQATLVRLEVADALGNLNDPAFRHYLLDLMNDPSPRVVAAALASVGRTGDREFVPHILERLSDRRYRTAASDALIAYGERIVGTVSDYIIDPSIAAPVRSRLCRVLSRIPTQVSVDALVYVLDRVESETKFHVIKALNALRARYPELRFVHKSLNTVLLRETESYYTILQILHLTDHPNTPADKLLAKALEEKIDQNLERIFRLLGLRYPARDIYSAYLGIVSTKKDLRANAIEFLDNILKKDLKKYIFPIMDNIDDEVKIRKGRELFGIQFEDINEALSYLIKGRDPWLRSCAIYTVTPDLPEALGDLVKSSRNDPHPVVRETSELVLERSRQ
ncbi:MAG: HEAT repeat domain-containing protein, partial [Candidatus Latescibacterota bacterium]